LINFYILLVVEILWAKLDEAIVGLFIVGLHTFQNYTCA